MKTLLLPRLALPATLFLLGATFSARAEDKPATYSVPVTVAPEAAPEKETPAAAPAAAGKLTREEIMKRFDVNGDGKLDENEKAAAHQAMKEARMARGAAGAAPGKGKGPLQNPEVRARLLKQFDANHDGKLDETERAAAKQYMEEHGGAVRERMLKRFDKNGDGKLDDEERAAMREELKSAGAKGKAKPKS